MYTSHEMEKGLLDYPNDRLFRITEVAQILEISKDTLSTWIRHEYIFPVQGLKGKRQVFQFTVLHLFQLTVMKILEDNLWLNLKAAALIAHQLFPDSDKSRNEHGVYYLPGTRIDPTTGMLHIEIPLEFRYENPRQFEINKGTRKERKNIFMMGLTKQPEGVPFLTRHDIVPGFVLKQQDVLISRIVPDSVMTISINPKEIRRNIVKRISKYVK